MSKKIRILYIGNSVSTISSGFDRLNKRNIELISKLTENNYTIIEFSDCNNIFDRICLHVGGTSFDLMHRVIKCLYKDKYDFVFLSSSLHGPLIKKIKLTFPEVKIICNFHNIEKQYAQEFLKVSGVSHLPFYLSARFAEKQAIKYMDYSMLLNERDASLLRKIYHKKASLILPIANEDTFNANKVLDIKSSNEIIYLFVGFSFFANIEGIRWFIKHVLPFVPGKLLIIGKGMDALQSELASEKVIIKGFVEDLSDYYYSATFVVSPILSGGGMKTKTAEALMYGKTIIGSKEAFEGYETEPKSMYICNSSTDYIRTIKNLIENNETSLFNKYSRSLFEKYYSINSVFQNFKNAFSSWKQN